MTSEKELIFLTKVVKAVRTFCEVLFIFYSFVVGYAIYMAAK